MSNQKVLVIGGGFAGARVAQDLVKAGLANVTLVDRKNYFEVTYATLRGVIEPHSLGRRSRMRYDEFIQGTFIQGEVASLQEHSATLADGTSLDFDYAVVASGSTYKTFPLAKSQDSITLDAREHEFNECHQQLDAAQSVLIIGGGAVGVEFAGEIAHAYPDKSVTLAEGASRLLGELSPKASATAQRQLEAQGVTVLLDTLLQPDDKMLEKADLVYRCLGLVPNNELMKANFSTFLDENDRIKVDSNLRLEGHSHIFAIGDCANVAEGKMGYTADMQGAAVAKNLVRAINGKKLKKYKPSPMMALIPTGPKTGLVQLPFGVTTLGFMVGMKQKDLFIARQFGNMGVKR